MTQRVLRLAADAFEWRSWNGEAVIYDAVSGDTHRLAHPSGQVLRALAQEPDGVGVDRLSRHVEGSAGADITAALGAVVDALVEIGIVEEAGVEDR